MKKLLILTTLAVLPLAACGGGGGDEAATSAGDAVAGKTAFSTNGCNACHGDTGLGDGPGAAGLTVKPRDYTDATWQGSVSDADIKNVIKTGGAANGLDPTMIAYGHLADSDIDNMVAYIRSLAK